MSAASYAKKGLLVCQIVSLAFLIASCSKDKIPAYSIGTGSISGNYQNVGAAIVRIVNENRTTNGFQLKYDVSPGSTANIRAIAAGETQFGIAQTDVQYQAVKGVGDWSDEGPQNELRAVFSIYAEAVTLVVGGDTDIRSISDLRGKIVDLGPSGSGTRRNAIDALRAAGIDWKDEIQARQESVDDRLAKFMRGELDAFFLTAGHPNTELKFATFSVRGARIIPLTNIDNLVSANPYYSRTVISSGLYPMADNKVDIETVGVNATLLASASVSDDVVYTVTKTVFENLDLLAEFNADISALSDDKFLEGLTAPVHPGAMRYYEEIGKAE